MEKISHIVRGNARLASTDMKGSAAVRPGAPSFGRPVGESIGPSEQAGTTAQRAAALNSEIEEKRSMAHDKVVDQLADDFFMTRIRRPADPETAPIKASARPSARESVRALDEDGEDPEMAGSSMHEDIKQPAGYTPRGSYIDRMA